MSIKQFVTKSKNRTDLHEPRGGSSTQYAFANQDETHKKLAERQNASGAIKVKHYQDGSVRIYVNNANYERLQPWTVDSIVMSYPADAVLLVTNNDNKTLKEIKVFNNKFQYTITEEELKRCAQNISNAESQFEVRQMIIRKEYECRRKWHNANPLYRRLNNDERVQPQERGYLQQSNINSQVTTQQGIFPPITSKGKSHRDDIKRRTQVGNNTKSRCQ